MIYILSVLITVGAILAIGASVMFMDAFNCEKNE
jgi:hypothetical protein